ncbi:MAG: hypothetical protein MJZ63_09745, partial [Muribaculaceae bacterium]|nr:hypothetical protein [Muribaculaceae bacterium]
LSPPCLGDVPIKWLKCDIRTRVLWHVQDIICGVSPETCKPLPLLILTKKMAVFVYNAKL